MNSSALMSPTLRPFTLGEDLTSKTPSGAIPGTLRGLDIWAAGDVEITDVTGITVKRTFTVVPYRWVIQIAMVTNNTTVLPANLDGLV